MKLDLGVEVTEVSFEEFERRKAPRGNISLIQTQNRVYFADLFSEAAEKQIAPDFGIEVDNNFSKKFGAFETNTRHQDLLT
jgi:hypothetical protein